MTETTPSVRRRFLGVLAAAVLVVAGLGHAPASADGCDFQFGWESITPDFPEGTPAITSVASYRFDPFQLYVANDRSVVYTADAGCSFHPGLQLGTQSEASAAEHIVKVVIAPDDSTRIYALAEEAGPVKRPHVYRSIKGGAPGTWSEVATGLEAAVGPAVDLGVAVNDGPLYLLVGSTGQAGVATPSTLYSYDNQSENTWQPAHTFGAPVSLPVVGSSQTNVRGVVVDPAAPDDVWVYGDDGLLRSNDRGVEFASLFTKPVSALDLIRSNSGIFRALALAADAPKAYYSFDAANFVAMPLPARSVSIAPGRDPFEVVIASEAGGVYRTTTFFDPAGTTNTLATRPVSQVVTSIADRILVIYGRSATTVQRLFLPGPPLFGDPDVPTPPEIVVGNPPKVQKPGLFPDSSRIRMTAGERRTVPVRLLLPGTRKLDVFFLIDTSGSMGEEMAGVRSAVGRIVKALVAKGVDVQFGWGQYHGYDVEPAYQLRRDISDDYQELVDDLGNVGAGGAVNEESMLSALQQVATGTGEGGNPYDTAYIAPGQNAHFRKGSLRVIVHGTDETFWYGDKAPSAAAVAADLGSVHALQVGLAFQEVPPPRPPLNDPFRKPYDPGTGLRDMADRTKAVATSAGVDCDGDGAKDLAPGKPLVCTIDPSHSEEASVMAPAIVGLLLGLKDEADVHIEAKGPPGTVGSITPGSRHVDFTQQWDLRFGVELACPQALVGQSLPVHLQAIGRQGATLATGKTTIVCGSVIVPAVPIIPPIIFQPPLPQQPIPNSQPNPQPQPNAQGAFAAQKQEQTQVVYGYINPQKQQQVAPQREGPVEDKFAMSEYRDRGGVPPAATYLTGAAMAAAFGIVTRRRTRAARVRVATVRTRGRNR
jgi:hypothetical protein